MTETIKPIKRSVYLAPLSREHHEGLLLAWKIRRAIFKDLAPSRIVEYCLWFYKTHLEEHFANEENGFANLLGVDDPLYLLMMSDHRKLREMIGEFTQGNGNSFYALEKFASFLCVHVRFEERVLFNHIQSTTTKEELEAFAKNIVSHSLPDWADEFWLN